MAGVYKKLVVGRRTRTLLLGGILVGDASAYGMLRPMVAAGIPLPDNPEELILPAGAGAAAVGAAGLPDEAQVCSCNDVTKGDHLRRVAATAATLTRPCPMREERAPGPGPAAGPACRC